MPDVRPTVEIGSDVSGRRQRILADFEDAWRRGEPPSLRRCVAECREDRVALLADLARRDLEHRFANSQSPRVESYLAEFPELASNPAVVLDLIVAEFHQRSRLEGPVDPGEYLHRFPQFRNDLEARLPSLPAVPRRTDVKPVAASTATGHEPTVLSISGEPTAPAPLKRVNVPGYEILGELGRGGMGVVYQARQVGLNRLVALKMILSGAHAGTSDLARFRAEAEAIAKLQHPNIVQVYEIREQDGLPCFSLEFVDGGSLAQKLAISTITPRQAAQLIETVARAVHAAHTHDIVHRDLKPANILLTHDGMPKITDFGLAKRVGVESGQTASGAVIGTPSYMAPEQAEGRQKAIGPHTDVYALGAILYELLTGRPPFEGETMLDTLKQVIDEEVVPPSKLSPRLPRDLETICLKCLQKPQAKRYASAQALADDLHCFLNGDPIKARPVTRWERLVHGARRHPLATTLIGAAVIALVGLVVGLFLYNALAVSMVAVLSLLAAGWWYNARLQRALREASQQQLAAERQVERVNLLLEMTRQVMSAPNVDVLLRLLSETTTRMLNADRATIFLIDWERREVWSRVAMGEGVGEIRVPLGVGIAGAVAMTGETINLPDAYADSRFNREVDRRTGYHTRNLLATPMLGENGKIVGVFQVLNKKEGPFLPEDVAALSQLAASACVAVQRARPAAGM